MVATIFFCSCNALHPPFPLLQILSRTKPVQAGPLGGVAKEKRKKQKLPRLEDFLAARDYTGALTLLEVRRRLRVLYCSAMSVRGKSKGISHLCVSCASPVRPYHQQGCVGQGRPVAGLLRVPLGGLPASEAGAYAR